MPLTRQHAADLAETALKLVVAGVVVAVTYTLVRTGVLKEMVTHPVVFCLMLDCFLIHVCTGAGRREAMVTAGLAVAAWLAWPLLVPRPLAWPWERLEALGSLLGLASLFVLSFAALTTRGAAGRDKLRTFGRSSIFLCMAVWSIPFLAATNGLRPEKFDAFLYRFDAGFGLQPSFLIGRLFAASPLLHDFESAIYVSLALPVGLVYIGHLRHEGRWTVDLLQALLLNSAIGYALFWVFPAAGPVFAFPEGYPLYAPLLSAVDAKPMMFSALPNAMPSVHISTALLVWFNSRPWPLARTLALVFLLCTILSALGLGEHYLVDLVVAFPYAVAIQAVSVPGARRALILAALLTGGWLALLRTGQPLFPSPAVAGVASVITIAAALYLESRIAGSVFLKAAQA